MKRLWLSLSILLMPLSSLAGVIFYLLGAVWRQTASVEQQKGLPPPPRFQAWPLSRYWLWGFVLCSGLTLFVTPQPLEHLAGWLSRYLVPAGLVLSHLRLLQQGVWTVKQLVNLMLASGLLLSAVALGNYFWQWQMQYQGLCLSGYGQPCLIDFLLLAEDRARSFSMHSNVLGVLLMLLLPLALLTLNAARGLHKLPVLGLLSTLMLAIGVSFSRGAWLGTVWCLLVGSFYLLNASWRQGGALLALGATALALVSGKLNLVSLRLQELVNLGGSAGTRVAIWQTGLEMLTQHPWLGVGLLQVERLYQVLAPQGPPAGHLHNWPLQVAVESGLPAALILFGALAYLLARPGKNPLDQATWVSLTALGWASLVDATVLDLRVSFNLTLLLALLLYSRWQQAYLAQIESEAPANR